MGKGKGKGGGGRGHGRQLAVDNAEEMALREREIEEQRKATARRRAGSDAEESGSAEDDDAGETVFGFDRTSGADATLAKSAAGLKIEDDAAAQLGYQGERSSAASTNPNHNKKNVAPAMTKVKKLGDNSDADATIATAEEAGFNRKQREAIAAAKAQEDYLRRHLAGETEEAKRQLAQLAIVRARREAAKAKREAEGRAAGMSSTGIESSDDEDEDSDDRGTAKAKPKSAAPAAKAAAPVVTTGAAGAEYRAQLAAKAANEKKKEAAIAAASSEPAASGPPMLKAMDIKKMNGDALKDALKERGLSTQGAKKDLMSRLTDYEAKR